MRLLKTAGLTCAQYIADCVVGTAGTPCLFILLVVCYFCRIVASAHAHTGDVSLFLV